MKKELLLKCFYVRYGYIISWVLGILICEAPNMLGDIDNLVGFLVFGYIFGSIFVHPIILTVTNLVHLFVQTTYEDTLCSEKIAEGTTILKGVYLTYMALWTISGEGNRDLMQWVYWGYERFEVLLLMVLIAMILAGLSYLYLRYTEKKNEKQNLVMGSCIVMYVGIFISTIWILFMLRLSFYNIYLCLWPLNCIIIAIKLLRQRMREMPENCELA